MAKTIVFPTDFSTASDAALDHAAALAKSTGAALLIVHVEEPPLAYGGGTGGDCGLTGQYGAGFVAVAYV
jgi:nucleotide-binding universal stress UspA family protein